MRFPFGLRAHTPFDVLGFGTNAVDHLIRVPQFPQFGSKIEMIDYCSAPGGEVASTMVGLTRLGSRTAYAGRFGSDEEGKAGLESLDLEGVECTLAEIVDGARTQVAFIVIDEQTGERTIMWQRDGGLAYTADDAPVAGVERCRVLHMTAHDTAACIRMAKAARQEGVIVSLDIDNIFERTEELLPLIDICIASADFSQKLTGEKDNKTALSEIAKRFGCPLTGLTLGDAGSIVLCENEFFETAGFSVPGGCVDTTGAGDAFRTGFLYGLLNGRTVEETSLIANAVAALKCRRAGARSGLPYEPELASFLVDGGLSR